MSWMLVMMRRMMDGKNKDRQRIKIKIESSQRRPHSIIKSFTVHIILLNDLAGVKTAQATSLYTDSAFTATFFLVTGEE